MRKRGVDPRFLIDSQGQFRKMAWKNTSSGMGDPMNIDVQCVRNEYVEIVGYVTDEVELRRRFKCHDTAYAWISGKLQPVVILSITSSAVAVSCQNTVHTLMAFDFLRPNWMAMVSEHFQNGGDDMSLTE